MKVLIWANKSFTINRLPVSDFASSFSFLDMTHTINIKSTRLEDSWVILICPLGRSPKKCRIPPTVTYEHGPSKWQFRFYTAESCHCPEVTRAWANPWMLSYLQRKGGRGERGELLGALLEEAAWTVPLKRCQVRWGSTPGSDWLVAGKKWRKRWGEETREPQSAWVNLHLLSGCTSVS